jgi:hypothetical protein
MGPVIKMDASVSRLFELHLSRQPKAAPKNGEKYGVPKLLPEKVFIGEARACLQHPPQAMRKSYALCVVCGNPRTLKR